MNITTPVSTSVVFLSLFALVGCEQAPVEAPEVVRPVRMITISSLQAGDSLSYPCEIQGAQNVNIAFEVSGRIVEMPAQEGIEVSTGDVLARLDPADVPERRRSMYQSLHALHTYLFIRLVAEPDSG